MIGGAPGNPGVPPLFHAVAAAWIIGMLVLAEVATPEYRQLLQEDHFVEWWTVGLFAAAAIVRLRHALPRRRIFDLLVALFCIFVAGEEFSWGQRLVGFTPPAAFLEHNTQQELNLHNFADVFGKPKGVLILALLGYGGFLPVVGRTETGKQLMERVGATAPPRPSLPWFVGAAALLYWYPVTLTGEWVEALAGALFLMSAVEKPGTFWRGALVAAAAAAALTVLSGRRAAAPVETACAQRETEGLLRDISAGHAARSRLRGGGTIHKRVWTAIRDGYLDELSLLSFEAVVCEGESPERSRTRRRYAVDPWGTAYWIRTQSTGEGRRRVVVYSMGPNRRRDGAPGGPGGDDIRAVGELRTLPD